MYTHVVYFLHKLVTFHTLLYVFTISQDLLISHVVYSLHNRVMFHTVAYVLVTPQDRQISNRELHVALRCIFFTQSSNVPYSCVCSGYTTRPADF